MARTITARPGSPFGAFLLDEFARVGWRSMREAAAATGLHRDTIRNLITQTEPEVTLRTVAVLAKALKRPPHMLLRAYGVVVDEEFGGQRGEELTDPVIAELLDTARFLHPQDRQAILEYAAWRRSQRRGDPQDQ